MPDLFVELLHEELPASMVRPALEALRDGILGLVQGIERGAVHTYATPRRLAVAIADVAEAKPLTERVVTGPPAERAVNPDGTLTDVGKGFAKGKGVSESEVRIVDGPKGPLVAVTVREGGERTVDVVGRGLEGVVLGLPFAKSMEWGNGGIKWARPLHRVAAMYGPHVIPTKVGTLVTGHATLGHRLSHDPEFEISSVPGWLAGLRYRQVEPDLDARKDMIRAHLVEAAGRLDSDPIRDDTLLEEVTHLVEWPVLVLGEFDADLLDLPPRLLVQSMKQNQRYFPVFRGGELTNRFVVISNNPWGDEALVARGNAAVLKARFYDARFFFAEDKKVRLEEHGTKLGRMQWIRGLGSMADKQARVAGLAADLVAITGGDATIASRAGALSKSDLTTLMVGEFPELQGHVGRLLATAQGEPPAVAVAIEESWLPRYAGDLPPKSREGAALALADRLDTLVGCFGVGITPTGGGDPQGLRRAASGLLAIVDSFALRVDLAVLFGAALVRFHAGAKGEAFARWTKERGNEPTAKAADKLVDELVAFTLTRLEAQAVADGASADVVQAVLSVTIADPLVIGRKVAALRALAGKPEFAPILQTFKRVLNITKGQSFPAPAAASLDGAERALHDATAAARTAVVSSSDALDFDGALAVVTGLQAPVAAFFDAVLVDDPDPAVKARRMGLLLDVASLFRQLADFSRISTR